MNPPASNASDWLRVQLVFGLAVAASMAYAGLQAAQRVGEPEALGTPVAIFIGAGLFAVCAWGLSTPESRQRAGRLLLRLSGYFRLSPRYLLPSLLPLGLSLGAWVAASSSQNLDFPLLAALLWAGALGSLLFVAVRAGGGRTALPWRAGEARIALALAALALLLRAANLADVPWLLTGDEASAGLTAVNFLEGGWNNPFRVQWLSFPSLYFTLPAASIRLLGQTAGALRLPSALAGTATVILVYAVGRRLFGRELALPAAVFMAAFHFHVHFSRIGLNNVWDGLFYILVFGLWWSAWVDGRPATFLWSGLALGLSQYFYTSARVLPFILIGWLVIAAIKDFRLLRQRAAGILLTLIGALTVSLPLWLFYAEFPEQLTAPFLRVAAEGNWFQLEMERTGLSAAVIMLNQLRDSFLAFFSTQLRHWYLIDRPMLLPLSSSLFGMGLIVLLLRIRDLRHVWLALWLASGIAIGALSHSTPAAQRYIQVAPAVALTVALPLATFPQWLAAIGERWRRRATYAATALLVAMVFNNFAFYFFDFSSNQRFGDHNTETAQAVADYLQDWPAGTHAIFLGGRMGYYTHSTIPYLAPHIWGEDRYEPLTEPPEPDSGGPPILYLVLPERGGDIDLLAQTYPQGLVQEHIGKDDQPLFISFIP